MRDVALKRDQTPRRCGENGRDILTDDEDQRSLREKRNELSHRRCSGALVAAEILAYQQLYSLENIFDQNSAAG